ncbi:hypothetical protein [Actinoplanes sp. GCM10030250]|uniref:hypothetical protein n=1 Tax=Actinoplanes sp. GCM10030250 TaxID=3273376 RepID=UPI003617362F
MRLWSVTAESAALAMAGPGAETHVSPDTVLAAGPDTIVVVVEGGVRTAEDLAVTGPFPSRIAARLTAEPAPTLLAFARLPETPSPEAEATLTEAEAPQATSSEPAEGCLALGSARVIRLGRRRGALQDLSLYLEAPLPYDLLDRVRPTGPPPEQPGLDWLDLLPGDPITALEQFVTGWYADVPPAHDAPEPATAQPEPLRAFHRAAAGRTGLYDGGSLLIFPELGDGFAFAQEGDGVFTLHTEAGENPPVWYHGLSDHPLRERERLSGFLMLTALTRAAMDSSPGGMAFVDRAQLKRIVAPMRRVPLRPMRWPCARSRFYAEPGLVVLAGDDHADWYEVYVGARHRSLLRRFRKLGLDWERFDG